MADIFEREPDIGRRLASVAWVPTEQRVGFARAETEQLPRAGWVRIGAPGPIETVAEHTDDMVMLAGMLNAPGYQLDRVQRMAKVHDLPEGASADITPKSDISKADKKRLEHIAATIIFESDATGMLADWREFEFGSSPERTLTHDLDQLQMLGKALEIEANGSDLRQELDDFWQYAEQRIVTTVGRQFFENLVTERQDLHAGRTPYPARAEIFWSKALRPPVGEPGADISLSALAMLRERKANGFYNDHEAIARPNFMGS